MELEYREILYLTICAQYCFAKSHNLEAEAEQALSIINDKFHTNEYMSQFKLINLNEKLIHILQTMDEFKPSKLTC